MFYLLPKPGILHQTKLNEPALRVRLTERGLNYAGILSQHLLQDQIYNISFPPFSLYIAGGPGYGRVTVHKMDIQSFQAPEFKYHLSPPHGIAWRSTGGFVSLKGLYRISSNRAPWGALFFRLTFWPENRAKNPKHIRGDAYHFWDLAGFYWWGAVKVGALIEEIRYQ